MLIVCRVCAEFRRPDGTVIFTVGQHDLDGMIEAPDEITIDPLFDLLKSDRSLEAVVRADQKKRLENDPHEGIGADGKKTTRSRKSAKEDPAKADPAKEDAGREDPAQQTPAAEETISSPEPQPES